MSFSPEQWRAIAARTMAQKGKKRGKAYLHMLKQRAEREGVPLVKHPGGFDERKSRPLTKEQLVNDRHKKRR